MFVSYCNWKRNTRVVTSCVSFPLSISISQREMRNLQCTGLLICFCYLQLSLSWRLVGKLEILVERRSWRQIPHHGGSFPASLGGWVLLHAYRAQFSPMANARIEKPLLQPTPVPHHFGKACGVSQQQLFVLRESTSLAAVLATLPAQSLDELLLTENVAERPRSLHHLPLNPGLILWLQATALFIKGILLSSF